MGLQSLLLTPHTTIAMDGVSSIRSRRAAFWIASLILIATAGGCSLVLLGLRVVYGDPVTKDKYQRVTGTDLTEGEKSVLILCTVPYTIRSEVPELQFDLIDGLARKLKNKGVKLVSTGKVATWIDDHGGVVDESEFPSLAAQTDADVIVLVKIEQFDYREENSPDLFRGRARGTIHAWSVARNDSPKSKKKTKQDKKKKTSEEIERELANKENRPPRIEEAFLSHFDLRYPLNNPVISRNVTRKTFLREFSDRLIAQLGMYFHSYRQSEVPF